MIAAALVLSPTLTYRGTAPLGRLIPELARRTGRSLASSPSVDADVVALSVRGVDPGDALARLARVAGAEWREEAGGVRRLVRPPGPPDRAEEATEAMRAALARAAPGEADFAGAARRFAAVSTRMEANDSGPAFWRDFLALRLLTPVGRLHARLLAAIGPEALAAIPAGGRVVYSDRPNARQRPLPRDGGDLLTEQRAWARAMGGVRGNLVVPGGKEEYPAPPARILLVTTARGGGVVDSRLTLADATGATLGEGDLTLGEPDYAEEMARYRRPEPEDAAAPKIAPGPEAAAFLLLSRPDDEEREVPADALARLRRPLERDPLDYLAADPLVRAAEGRNVVALLTDGAAHEVFLSPPGPTPATMVRRRLAIRHVLREDGGWLEVAPRAPALSRSARTSRTTLDAIARASGLGALDLDDRAALAWRFRNDANKSLATAFWRAMRPSGTRSDWTTFGDPAWQIYGSLDAAARKRAASEGLDFPSLSPDQRRVLERAYVAWGGYRTVPEEPTERFPAGLTREVRLRVKNRDEDTLEVPTGRGSDRVLMSETELAHRVFAAKHRDASLGPPMPPAPPRIRPLRRREVDVWLTFGAGPLWSGTLSAWSSGPAVPVSSLPRPWRERLEARLADLERDYRKGIRILNPSTLPGSPPPVIPP